MAENVDDSNKRIKYRAFADLDEYYNDLYSIYRNVYSLVPEKKYEERLDDSEAMNYCKSRKYFVIIMPYTSHGDILLERSFANNKLGWISIGGGLRSDEKETFIAACVRHASKTMQNIQLGEIEPVAFLENKFCYNNEIAIHKGIAFVGRIRNIDPFADLKKSKYTRGHLFHYGNTAVKMSLDPNQNAFEEALKHISKIEFDDSVEHEISENIRYKKRYIFHEKFVKRLLNVLSHIYKISIHDLYDKINKIILENNCKKYLDIACGENTAVFQIAKMQNMNLVIGNDVSWGQIDLIDNLKKEINENEASFILFTNHDARRLPFIDSYFDIVMCKNVLHHMNNLNSVEKLINEVIRVGKRSLIIEIMNPKYEGHWGRIRHKYYKRFLHDAGDHFLSRDEFKALMPSTINYEYFEMKTIRGIYMFSIIKR
jgi:ubiquinone/menaquinone biosynthesis C-methylase UbiE